MNNKHIIRFTLLVTLILCAVLAMTLSSCGPDNSNKVSEIYIAKTDVPRLTYVEGQELDLTDGKLTAVVNGTETKLPLNAPEVAVSGYDKNVIGEQTVTFTYSELTTTVKVNVIPRAVAENYETKYFVGGTFNKDMGKVKIATDDAKVFTVNMKDEKISLISFDSSEAGTSTVTVMYSDGINSYYCQFDVTIYEQTNIEFTPPTKTEYNSHDGEVNVNGGFFKVTSSDSTLTQNQPLTADMISGFDLSAATLENRKTPLEQTVTVEYLGKQFTYKIYITFSGLSAVNYYGNNILADIDWAVVKENGLSEAETDAAMDAIKEYYALSEEQRALLSDEVKNNVGRAGAIAAGTLFHKEFATYSNSLSMNEQMSIFLMCTSYEKTVVDVERLNNPNTELRVYTKLLRQTIAEFGEAVLIDEIKVSDIVSVFSEEMENSVIDTLNHLIDVFALLKDIPAEWNKETLKAYGDDILTATMQIYNAGYYKKGGASYYTKVLSPWREKNDIFEILYTYFLYDYENSKEFMVNYMWGSMPMPGLLETWYSGLNAEITYANYFKNYSGTNAYLADVSAYMYTYFYTLEVAEEIKKSENQLWIDIYNQYNGDYMNHVYMYTYSYGYLHHVNGMIDSEAFHTLWEKYYEVLKLYNAKTLNVETHKELLCEMVDAFEALTPSELLGFLSSLNLMYTNAKGILPMLGHTPSEEEDLDKVYNVFSLILGNYYEKYLTDATATLFNDLLSAMENYVLIGYKDKALETFNTIMAKISEDYAALSEADKANFNEYFGESYSKYLELYNVTSGKNEITLTDEETARFEEFKLVMEKYFTVYGYAYQLIQANIEVPADLYPVLYALYAQASELHEAILATGSESAKLALYTTDYEFGTIKYTLDKAYYIIDTVTTSVLTSQVATIKLEGAVAYVTYWNLYADYGFDVIFADMADLFYAAYYKDGNPLTKEYLQSVMNTLREFNKFKSNIFTFLNADKTYRRALGFYYDSVLSEAATSSKVAENLLLAESAYTTYTIDKENADNLTNFITLMETVKESYETLSEDDKSYLSDMYEYYLKLYNELKNAQAAA